MRVGANTPQRDNPIAGGHPTVRHAVESILLEERTRWAMQIHDGLTQSVTSAILELQTAAPPHRDRPREARSPSCTRSNTEIREDLRHIRERALRDDVGGRRDLDEPTLAALIRDFAARWRLPATVTVEGDIESLDDATVEAAYAIASEALANAAKHSGAPDAHVHCRSMPTRSASRCRIAGAAWLPCPTPIRTSASGS